MTSDEIRTLYLENMAKNGHAIIPSSSLVPENDPTTLFTGSGMQSLVPYLMGETHPSGTRVSNSQKCFRAEDIEEVGDNRHTTFFEMLGNWSFGDYFKEEQLTWFYEFLVNDIKLDPKKIYVTVFAGDEASSLPKDEESVEHWKKLFQTTSVSSEVAFIGSEKAGGERGMKEGERIFYYDSAKNWWSRAGKPEQMPEGEIGGPDSEVFYDFGTPHDEAYGKHCHPNCDCGRFSEIGNSVFMQYVKNDEGGFSKLPKRNVDFGGGLERIASAKNSNADMFKIDTLWSIIEKIQEVTGKTYEENVASFRVIADHMRAAVFLIADGVYPGNKDRQYFVRRLLRRVVRYADILSYPQSKLDEIAEVIIALYGNHYKNLQDQREIILEEIRKEETQFRKTLEKGMGIFEKMAITNLSGHDAYILFTTYGFPYELTEELAKENNLTVSRAEFDEEMKKHQEASRAGAEQKFKGGLADNSEKVIQYHTATHLLLTALRKTLGEHVHQAGSNITSERLRFDFTHDEKVQPEQLEEVQDYVNKAIKNCAKVSVETMDKDVAQDDPSIEGSFWEKYPDKVKVYTIKDDSGTVYSKELCGGPHVETTNHIQGRFKIVKEESSARGVRRIKATIE